MLTGRAAELRPDINYLQPRITVLVRPEDATQPYMADGEYEELLRTWSRNTNMRRAQASRARNAGRDIPTSGTARRRAKQHRNRGLCLGKNGADRCQAPTRHGGTRCWEHDPHAPRVPETYLAEG